MTKVTKMSFREIMEKLFAKTLLCWTRKDDLTCEIGLLTGIHKVEVKRDGYEPHSMDVLVEAGKSIPLTIELKKAK